MWYTLHSPGFQAPNSNVARLSTWSSISLGVAEELLPDEETSRREEPRRFEILFEHTDISSLGERSV